jgi:hypothetical protein
MDSVLSFIDQGGGFLIATLVLAAALALFAPRPPNP